MNNVTTIQVLFISFPLWKAVWLIAPGTTRNSLKTLRNLMGTANQRHFTYLPPSNTLAPGKRLAQTLQSRQGQGALLSRIQPLSPSGFRCAHGPDARRMGTLRFSSQRFTKAPFPAYAASFFLPDQAFENPRYLQKVGALLLILPDSLWT